METPTPNQQPPQSPGPQMPHHHKWTPLVIALGIAILAGIFYVASGRNSLDSEVRELSQEESVQKVDTSDPQKIAIECKNGDSYEILFTEGQQNYDDLIFSACGPDGVK